MLMADSNGWIRITSKERRNVSTEASYIALADPAVSLLSHKPLKF